MEPETGIRARDFPKLESPFVREMQKTASGAETYACTSKVNEKLKWVFDEPDVECSEKLDGTNVSIIIEDSAVKQVWNRMERLWDIGDGLPLLKGKEHIVQGVINSYHRGYFKLDEPMQLFGELCGPRVNGNPLKLDEHVFFPFDTYVREHLVYKSWGKHPKNWDSIHAWFTKPIADGGIFSLYRRKKGQVEPPEGVVFLNPKTGERAKLRRDMFIEYEGEKHDD